MFTYAIQITPWGLDSTQMMLYSSSEKVNLQLYEVNGEWEIVHSVISNYSR